MAADGAVSFLLQKIDYLLSREWSLLSGIDNEVDGLKHEFETIGALLREADTKGGNNGQLRVWIKQVRDLAYDIEDVLDMFAFRTAKASRAFPKFLQFIKRRSIAILIQDINTKLHGTKETRERYRAISSSDQISISGFDPENNTYLHPRLASLYMDETDIVGIEEPRNRLMAWAVDKEPKLKVMFVVGMGGSGKTLLVKKVFEELKSSFDCSAWIPLSKSNKKEELLLTMMKRFFDSTHGRLPPEFFTTSLIQLMDKLRGYLQNKRYLIVFDDLWSKDVWESIQYALPNQNRGRIIIATRRGDIARLCSHNSSVSVYNLQPLSSDNAQQLFYKKVFPLTNECPKGLVEWSRKLLHQCEGLPLGIVSIGNLLSNTDKTADEWRKLHDSLGSELESEEGLIKEVVGKSLEEVAEDYLKELIQRKLVLVNEIDFDGRARNCRVHHLLHKIILSKSHEENFCRVSTGPEMSFNEKVRRLSVHKTCSNMLGKKFSRGRSLFLFGMEMLTHSISQTILSGFSILKVLDLEGAPLDKFPNAITRLILLKYLSLKNTNIRKLPKSIKKLQNLETLDLKQTFVMELPKTIIKLEKLRHLLVYRYDAKNQVSILLQGCKACRRIGGLLSLQKLSVIKANGDDGMIKALGNLTQLRKLGIIDLKDGDGKHLCLSIANMNNLQSLHVASITQDEFLDLNAMPATLPKLLQRLSLKGRLKKLPDWVPSLHDLIRIRLKGSKLESNPIDALEDLPNLMELQLLDAYAGNQLVFRPGKFQNLKILELESLIALEFVIMEQGALPSLEKLITRRCQKLKMIPRGIDKLLQLREFHLYDMPEKLVNGLQKNSGEFRQLVRHIPLITSYSLESSGYWKAKDLS
ncbi:disease resistance protein RPM1-like isoform X2 [Durio zibethinus]|uniref:Disease resistance protein RPM1-like isoform X2 n=1 Tax=Durio zibethinus TaxID=66656 RepID=A0A6P5Y024_DURZI|nr:disease resistance protein RPM1-like isoform X2 [Durio zibethinus]